MAPGGGFLARGGWMIGRPVASWGYGGPGIGAYIIVPLDGTVRVHVYAGGTVVTEPVLAGSVQVGATYSGDVHGAMQLTGSAWMHVGVGGAVSYSASLASMLRAVDLSGACLTSAALTGTVDGPALTGTVDGPALTGPVLTGETL